MTIPDITFDLIVEKTKVILGENYREVDNTNDDLKNICAMVIKEAAEWTNRPKTNDLQEVLNDCWPVIIKCACMAYLNRGSEGLNSQSELGQQNVYTDWIGLMHKQLANRRHIM